MTTQLNRPAAYSLGIIAAFAGIYFIWGTTYLGIALAIKTVPPFISGGVRFLIAGGLMYAWLRMRSATAFAGVNLRLAVVCGVLLSGIGNGYVGWSQQGIPSGIAALMVASVPVMVLVFDWVFFSKRTPTKQALVGIAIAVAGVATIVMHTHSLAGGAQPIYLLGMISANVAWSIGTLLQKRSARPEAVLGFTCVQMLAGGVFQLLMSVLDNEWQRFDPAQVSLSSVLAILYLVIFGSIVALNCYLWLLTRVAAQKVTTYALVNPVVALLLGTWFLDERLTFDSVAAAVLVLVGVALVLFQDISPSRLLKAFFPDKSHTVRSQR